MPFLSNRPFAAALSDEVLVILVNRRGSSLLLAHLFSTSETYEIRTRGGDAGGVDIHGMMVVWWEGTYDQETSGYIDQHVYGYRVPGGPKIDMVAGEENVGYPQVAGRWLTWVEGSPWEEAPDEYWRMPILGSLLDKDGKPLGEPISLVPSAVTSIMGDAGWTYTLSPGFLAWEQAAPADGALPGTHVIDLGTMETLALGANAWRPSLNGNNLVFWENGLHALNIDSMDRRSIDLRGDFGAAGPTFAAYYRPVDDGYGGYEVVARGYRGVYEQVLAQGADPPWLAAPIAVSATRIAFLAGDRLYLFEWESAS